MSAPSIRGSTAPTATLAPTSPSATAIGDLVVVWTWTRGGAGVPTHTLQSGFTEIRSHSHDDGSTDGRLSCAYKIATAAGATTYQAYTSSGSENVSGILVLSSGTFDSVDREPAAEDLHGGDVAASRGARQRLRLGADLRGGRLMGRVDGNGTDPHIVVERLSTERVRPRRESGRWHVSRQFAMWAGGIIVGMLLAAAGVIYRGGQVSERKADRDDVEELRQNGDRAIEAVRREHSADVRELRDDVSDIKGDIKAMRVEQRMILREVAPRAAAGLPPIEETP